MNATIATETQVGGSLERMVRRRLFVCCFCGTPRPKVWRGKGWTGARIQHPKQTSHWCCPNCKEEWDVLEHVHSVANGESKCKPPNNKLTDGASK